MKKKLFKNGFIYESGLRMDEARYLPAEFIFQNQQIIDLGLIPRIGDASELDIRESIDLIVATGCSKPLIRLGSSKDGGYLAPNDMEAIDACFSPGVGGKTDFEEDLSKKWGIPSYLCDDRQNESELSLDHIYHFFSKKRLGSVDFENFITLDNWVLNSNHAESDNLLLQMDIEGSEYNSILATSDSTLSKFRILVIEFHWIHLIPSRRFLNMHFNPVMRKLLNQFDCVHAHPNNCGGTINTSSIKYNYSIDLPAAIELTFYRKDLNKFKNPPQIPHPLDHISDENAPSMILGKPWNNESHKNQLWTKKRRNE